uniref:Probable DNA-directed RNA polymerases I, II, and III subunit RPABC3 n=1 Tax=Trichuris muris TaxID=70415 RepID=A0A5S6QH52_TRIMR
MAGVIFDDLFVVKEIDPDGKHFDRVSRLFCDSESFKVSLILDVNTQLYPVKLDDKFRIMLSSTLRDDGYPEEDEYDPCFSCQRLENFEYIMYGKVYRIETDESAGSDSCRVSVYASFGGLLLRLQGDANYMHGFEIDSNIYLLMKHLRKQQALVYVIRSSRSDRCAWWSAESCEGRFLERSLRNVESCAFALRTAHVGWLTGRPATRAFLLSGRTNLGGGADGRSTDPLERSASGALPLRQGGAVPSRWARTANGDLQGCDHLKNAPIHYVLVNKF